jgi:hypothetical protein
MLYKRTSHPILDNMNLNTRQGEETMRNTMQANQDQTRVLPKAALAHTLASNPRITSAIPSTPSTDTIDIRTMVSDFWTPGIQFQAAASPSAYSCKGDTDRDVTLACMIAQEWAGLGGYTPCDPTQAVDSKDENDFDAWYIQGSDSWEANQARKAAFLNDCTVVATPDYTLADLAWFAQGDAMSQAAEKTTQFDTLTSLDCQPVVSTGSIILSNPRHFNPSYAYGFC